MNLQTFRTNRRRYSRLADALPAALLPDAPGYWYPDADVFILSLPDGSFQFDWWCDRVTASTLAAAEVRLYAYVYGEFPEEAEDFTAAELACRFADAVGDFCDDGEALKTAFLGLHGREPEEAQDSALLATALDYARPLLEQAP